MVPVKETTKRHMRYPFRKREGTRVRSIFNSSFHSFLIVKIRRSRSHKSLVKETTRLMIKYQFENREGARYAASLPLLFIL